MLDTESQNCANLTSNKILNYPASTLPCNARSSQTRGAEVQNDKFFGSFCFPQGVRGLRPAFTLAEGATHVDISPDIRKPAFTLAEILITLGVIGVVAAMTLPMLAENYQRLIVETRLKKFYTTFNQAILMSEKDNEEYKYWNFWKLSGVYAPEARVSNFDYYLRPYLQIAQTQTVIYTNNTETKLYYLNDGSAFTFGVKWPQDIEYFPKDPVRCLRQSAKNRRGICSFPFHFEEIVETNRADVKYETYGMSTYANEWDGNVESLYTDEPYGCDTGNGDYCTFLIVYNDWHFPNDYPKKIRY